MIVVNHNISANLFRPLKFVKQYDCFLALIGNSFIIIFFTFIYMYMKFLKHFAIVIVIKTTKSETIH